MGHKYSFPIDGITEKKNYHWMLSVVFALFVFTFSASATQSSLVAGHMAEMLHTSQSAVLAADSLRLCATAASLFAANLLYERWGLRPVLMVSCALWTIPNFLFPFAPSVGWLYVFKFIQGLNSFSFPVFLATILKWAPSREHGAASAIFNGFYISGACLGSVTVMLCERIGAWYLSSVLIGLVALTGWIGIAYVAVDKNVPGGAGQNGRSPDKRAVYRMPATWLMILAFTACNWVDMAVNTDMPVYAQDMGFSVASSSFLMIAISIATLVSALVAGKVSDKLAGRSSGGALRTRVLVFAAGFVCCAVALVILNFVGSFQALAVCSVVIMIGASWASGTFWAIPPLLYGESQLNSGTGVCTAFSNLVCPVSTFVVGVLCGGNGAWAAGWFISAAVCVASMICGLLLIGQKPSGKTENGEVRSARI